MKAKQSDHATIISVYCQISFAAALLVLERVAVTQVVPAEFTISR